MWRTGLRRCRTSLGVSKTEIGKTRAETGAAKPVDLSSGGYPFGPQRLWLRRITRANVGISFTPGNHTAETPLTGWGERIRTNYTNA